MNEGGRIGMCGRPCYWTSVNYKFVGKILMNPFIRQNQSDATETR